MKSCIKNISSVWITNCGHQFPDMKRWLYCSIVFFCGVCLNSCFLHYYKTNSISKTDISSVQKLVDRGKYFILHANNQNFALINVKMNKENIEGEAYKLPPEHLLYLQPKGTAGNRYRKSNETFVLDEVHLYTRDSIAYESHISLPVKDFYKLDVYELDEKATRRSKVTSIVGVTLITAGVITLIAAAVSVNDFVNDDYGSCSPQLFACREDTTELVGILYSGAIFAPLQRTDYVPLAGIRPQNNQFQFQIQAGKNEELIIHETKLLEVTHEKDKKVLLGSDGKVLVYGEPVRPEKAFIGENTDIRKDISAIDENYYSFTNQPKDQSTSDIILNFKKPAGARSGKLVLRAKNSVWAVYLFKKFKSLYGDYYPTMVAQKDKADRKKLLQCELDQSLPLSVSVKDGNGWKFIDYFFTPGNQMPRDMIMEIDLKDYENMDQVQVKLETTYMFWDLDYAGMDFSRELPFKSTYIPADTLFKSGITPVVTAQGSMKGDIHLTDKEQLHINYSVKPASGRALVNSYFLVGNGYYHDNTRFEGKPQLTRLATFSRKGAFDKFSRETFEELQSLIKSDAGKRLATNN